MQCRLPHALTVLLPLVIAEGREFCTPSRPIKRPSERRRLFIPTAHARYITDGDAAAAALESSPVMKCAVWRAPARSGDYQGMMEVNMSKFARFLSYYSNFAP